MYGNVNYSFILNNANVVIFHLHLFEMKMHHIARSSLQVNSNFCSVNTHLQMHMNAHIKNNQNYSGQKLHEQQAMP